MVNGGVLDLFKTFKEPTSISNLEEEAASLAKFLNLKLENL